MLYRGDSRQSPSALFAQLHLGSAQAAHITARGSVDVGSSRDRCRITASAHCSHRCALRRLMPIVPMATLKRPSGTARRTTRKTRRRSTRPCCRPSWTRPSSAAQRRDRARRVCIRLCDQSSKHEHGGPVVCACEHLCVSVHALACLRVQRHDGVGAKARTAMPGSRSENALNSGRTMISINPFYTTTNPPFSSAKKHARCPVGTLASPRTARRRRRLRQHNACKSSSSVRMSHSAHAAARSG